MADADEHDKRFRKLQRGNGGPLKPFHWWSGFARSLFFADREASATEHGRAIPPVRYAVDVRFFADELSGSELTKQAKPKAAEAPATLFIDGRQEYRSNLPAVFPVADGTIEVRASMYGLTRMHFVDHDGSARQLQPHPSSAEGARARFAHRHPVASRVIGLVAILVLLTGLTVAALYIAEWITGIDAVAAYTGTFVSPVQLPDWANTALFIAGVLAAIERALTLRNHWLIDFDTTWTSFD